MNEQAVNPTTKKINPSEMLGSNRPAAAKSMPHPAANRWHNLIATNTAIAVGTRLSGNKAEVYVNGMRVQLKRDLVCYPDVVIVQGTPEFADKNADLLLNPTVVVEVVSSATNPLEKMQKLESYLAIESIKECLMVKADETRVEHYARQNAKQWIYRIYDERDAVVALESIHCKLSVSEIYAQVDVKQAELSSKAVN